MSAGLVAVGVFGAAHGVKGEIRLKSHTGEPLAIAGYGPLSDKTGRIFEIISARPVKDDMLVVRVKGVDDRNAAERLTHVELYAPRGTDPQKPHTRDELYVVVAGNGTFFCDGTRMRFETGDALFAPAHAEHRFEDFSDDLAVWVMFYGAEGGEAASPG